MLFSSFCLRLSALALGALMVVHALAQTPAPAPVPAPAPAKPQAAPEKSAPTTPPAAAAKPATPPAPGALKPMQEVLRDAKTIPGLLTLHQKDEKVWIAIRPEQFNQLMFFSYNVPRSVGERGLYGGQMGGAQAVVWRKVGNQVQLIAKNTDK
jgi:hypothetical protein